MLPTWPNPGGSVPTGWPAALRQRHTRRGGSTDAAIHRWPRPRRACHPVVGRSTASTTRRSSGPRTRHPPCPGGCPPSRPVTRQLATGSRCPRSTGGESGVRNVWFTRHSCWHDPRCGRGTTRPRRLPPSWSKGSGSSRRPLLSGAWPVRSSTLAASRLWMLPARSTTSGERRTISGSRCWGFGAPARRAGGASRSWGC